MIEVDFQAALVKAAIAVGGFGFKMSSTYYSGLPDILIQLPGEPTVMIECKRKVVAKYKIGLKIVSEPTIIQAATLTAFRGAGGTSALVTLIEAPRTTVKYIHVKTDFNERRITLGVDDFIRKAGEEWPIEQIIKRIVT